MALITGWELEYVDRLGALDETAIWQIYDAENAPIKRKGKK